MLSKPWLGVSALAVLVGGVAAGYGLRPPPPLTVASLDATAVTQALQPLDQRFKAMIGRFDRLERQQATLLEGRGGTCEGVAQPSSARAPADEDDPQDEVEEQKAREKAQEGAKEKALALAEGHQIVEKVLAAGHYTLEDRQSLFSLGGRLHDTDEHVKLLGALNARVNDGTLKMDF